MSLLILDTRNSSSGDFQQNQAFEEGNWDFLSNFLLRIEVDFENFDIQLLILINLIEMKIYLRVYSSSAVGNWICIEVHLNCCKTAAKGNWCFFWWLYTTIISENECTKFIWGFFGKAASFFFRQFLIVCLSIREKNKNKYHALSLRG